MRNRNQKLKGLHCSAVHAVRWPQALLQLRRQQRQRRCHGQVQQQGQHQPGSAEARQPARQHQRGARLGGVILRDQDLVQACSLPFSGSEGEPERPSRPGSKNVAWPTARSPDTAPSASPRMRESQAERAQLQHAASDQGRIPATRLECELSVRQVQGKGNLRQVILQVVEQQLSRQQGEKR